MVQIIPGFLEEETSMAERLELVNDLICDKTVYEGVAILLERTGANIACLEDGSWVITKRGLSSIHAKSFPKVIERLSRAYIMDWLTPAPEKPLAEVDMLF